MDFEHAAQGNQALLDAYCTRIGYAGPREARFDVLCALLEKQADTIAFEAIDVLLGRGVDIAPAAVEAKLLHRQRGGYCYEHNGLLRRVLEALGFPVEGLLARVNWGAAPDAPLRVPSHQALRVYTEGTWWLVDAGFGNCTPTAPLRLDSADSQPTPHGAYRLRPQGSDLQLEAQIGGQWKAVYRIIPGHFLPADYEPANWYSATHPASLFRNRLFVTRTSAQARYMLIGASLTVRRIGKEAEQRILDAGEIEGALQDIFGLTPEASWRALIEQAARDIPPV